MPPSSQDALENKPRLQIQYDVEIGGSTVKEELPWITGVMSDLSGDGCNDLPDVKNRVFTQVNRRNLDDYLRAQKPRAIFGVPDVITGGDGELRVDLRFEKMADFEPANLARNISPLAKLLELRNHLADLERMTNGKTETLRQLDALLNDKQLAKQAYDSLSQE